MLVDDEQYASMHNYPARENISPFVSGADPVRATLLLFKEKKDISGLSSEKELVDKLSLEETEPISNLTFGQVVSDSFAQNKGVIIGRMQTRDRVMFNKCFYHYFYAPNLVKLLVKTPMLFDSNEQAADEPLISRYHQTMPLTVRNPLNNEIVVGEVEFYLLSKPVDGEVT